MKKKLFILVPVFALIICALTPLTAFAVVQPTGKTAYTVAKDYGLTKGHDVVFKSGDDYYILCCPSSVTFGSVVNIYNVTDSNGTLSLENSVFFKAGTEKPANPETPGQKPNLSLSSSITSKILSPVLTEVVAILPVLLPVFLTFLAIRKGLTFTLTMLRSC